MIPRGLDATAANLILVSDKVRQVVAGQIPLPEVVELFLTNYCNFACPFCRCAKYHGDTRQFMDFDTLARLLEELVGQGVRRIELGGGGEPLEHPMIRQVLERFREQGFRFGLITNGWRLTEFPELVDSIIECADWVRFSLDGLTDDVYRIVHGRPNVAYQPLRAAIAELVRRARGATALAGRQRLASSSFCSDPTSTNSSPPSMRRLILASTTYNSSGSKITPGASRRKSDLG